MKLFHGTDYETWDMLISHHGLKGGDNLTGGNRGTWDHPRLFLTPDIWVAAKYGDVILVVEVDESQGHWINDGLGDRCFIIEGTALDELGDPDWDEILVPADAITLYDCCEEDACLVNCECDCSQCSENWRIR